MVSFREWAVAIPRSTVVRGRPAHVICKGLFVLTVLYHLNNFFMCPCAACSSYSWLRTSNICMYYILIYISLFLVRVTGIIPQPALGCWVWYLDSVNTRWATFVSRLQTSLGSPLPVSCEIIDCVSFDEPTHIKSHMCRHNFPPRRLWLPDGSLIPSDASRCLQMPPRCIQMPK